MPSESNAPPRNFTNDQLKLAVGEHERQLALIERDTIGWKWNVRQKDVLHVLGCRALDEEVGKELTPLTVTVLEETMVDEMCVSKTCAQNDISALIEASLVEKRLLPDSKKTKSVHLTNIGFDRWCTYADRRASLILTLHQALLEKGSHAERAFSAPERKITNSKVLVCVALLFCAISLVKAPGAKADVSFEPMYFSTTDNFGLMPEFLTAEITPSSTFDLRHLEVADRAGFYDRLLPKEEADSKFLQPIIPKVPGGRAEFLEILLPNLK